MLVVIPVCAKDASLVEANLALLKHFGGCPDFDAVIIAEGGTPLAALSLAPSLFHAVIAHDYDVYVGDARWPRPQNYAWQTAARIMAPLGQPWLWWEADATPLVKGWLTTLAAEYTRAARPFMGHILGTGYTQHMNGVGIYPANVAEHAMDAMICRASPFDMMLWKDIRYKTHSANGLIAHFPRFTQTQVSFDDIAVARRLVDKGAVLFHGCNDGSLAALLAGVASPQAVPTLAKVRRFIGAADLTAEYDESEAMWQKEAGELAAKGLPVLSYADCRVDMPAFTRQTKWLSGTFNLPHGNSEVHYNAGLVRDRDRLWLVTRRWLKSGQGQWQSSLTAWNLDASLYPTNALELRFPGRTAIDNLEDPRVVLHDGRLHVSYCFWRIGRFYRAHQSFSRFDANWNCVETWNVPFGGNGHLPCSGPEDEKNWVWFQHDSRWHILYSSLTPQVVVEVHGSVPARVHRTETTPTWPYGFVRGGTPPVRVGSEYITFFHSSLPWSHRQKRYYMGAMAFEAAPPFKPTRMTAKPLLIGSADDVRIHGGPLVIFPCGALLENGEWLLTFGVNDEAVGWLRIPQAELDALLTPL